MCSGLNLVSAADPQHHLLEDKEEEEEEEQLVLLFLSLWIKQFVYVDGE